MGDPILSAADLAFLAGIRRAILATRRPDGGARLVPVCFVVATEPDRIGRPIVHSPIDEKPKASVDPRDLGRVRDLLVLPEVSLLVDRWSEDWAELGWLRVDGRGELVEPEPREAAEHAAVVAALRAKYPQYADHDLESRPMIRITIVKATRWGAVGELPEARRG